MGADVGRDVEEEKESASTGTQTTIEFSHAPDGLLRMRPGGQGLPITFEFGESVPTSKIYVGQGMALPSGRIFTLAMRDRHAMAWADYNADGLLDVFINRGALGGTLRLHQWEISKGIKDELMLSIGHS